MPPPSPRKFSALVLAGQRAGVVNELAQAAGVSHKCIMPLCGRTLIEHTLSALVESPHIGQIIVSIDDVSALDGVGMVRSLEAEGRLAIVEATDNLFGSVKNGLANAELPALITTADNVLLTPEMIAHFCGGVGDLEAVAALASKETIESKYPSRQKGFHRFRDGEWSNCNLYAICTPNAVSAAEVFKGGGQFAKSRERALRAFGLVNTLIYRFALLDHQSALGRLGRRFGVKLGAVDMPFPEAPIDVDNERSKQIAGDILEARMAA